MEVTQEKIKEFEEKFVGDNYRYGIGHMAWEKVKPFLTQALEESYSAGYKAGQEKIWQLIKSIKDHE